MRLISPVRNRAAAVAGAVCVGLLGFACAPSQAPPSGASHPLYRFSCCRSADIQHVYHPGDILTLHWIVTPAGRTSAASQPVTLSLSVEGAYADVSSLKSGAHAAQILRAATISTSDQAGAAEVSTIQLPQSLEPGYYNLVFTVGSGGIRSGGASVIQVSP